jgi:MoxR-like ATPase
MALTTKTFQDLFHSLNLGLYEREKPLAVSILALFCGEHLFFYGPPGVAKSLLARRLRLCLKDSRHFEYLMGRFSVPEEIFGPFSLSALKDSDQFRRKTEGYLPEADIAFLDEIWRSSSPIQNSLLTILNERVFRNGAEEHPTPLKTLVAAANSLPQTNDDHQAIWDRFLFRLVLDPISSPQKFSHFLQSEEPQEPSDLPAAVSQEAWEEFQTKRDASPIPPELVSFLNQLRSSIAQDQGLDLAVSDRRWKKIVRVLKTAGMLEGRSPDQRELHLVEHTLWNRPEDKPKIQNLLVQNLEHSPIILPWDPQDEEKEYEGLKKMKAQTFQKTREERRWVPELFQGEYLRCREPWEGETVQIWREDWENLSPAKSEGIELILFDESTGSRRIETVPATKITSDPPKISIENYEYQILATEQTVLVEDTAELSPQEQERWDQKLKAYQEGTRDRVKALMALKEEYEHQPSFFPKEHYWTLALIHRLDLEEKALMSRLADLESEAAGAGS